MKMKKAPYFFLSIFFGLALLLFVVNTFNYLTLKARTENMASLHSELVDPYKAGEKPAPAENRVDFSHTDSSKNPAGNSSELTSKVETSSYHGESELNEPTQNEDEERLAPQISYNKKHILIKFAPEVEYEIAQGKQPGLPGRPKRMLSGGKVWEVEIDENESVEELLDTYRKEYPHLIEYTQFDYECGAIGRSGKGHGPLKIEDFAGI